MKNKLATYDYQEGKAFISVTDQAGFEYPQSTAAPVKLKPKYNEEIYITNIPLDVAIMDSSYYQAPDFTTGEVVMKSNYSPSEPVAITSETKVNLNGKKITAPLFTESNGEVLEGNSDSYGFWVKKGASLTIEGKGEVVAQDATYSMAIWADGGDVTIKGGTFRNGGDSCDLIYASNGGNVVIEGGEFFPAGPASGTAPGTKNPYTALNVKDKDYKSGVSNIIVKGGIFHNFNPADNVSETEHTNFVAEGYKAVEVKPNVWEVTEE